MFTLLTLSLAIGAPVPPSIPPIPAGTAPRVVELKPDDHGKVTIDIVRTEMRKITLAPAFAPAGGGAQPAPAPATREIAVPIRLKVELADVKDLTITTADGKKLDKEEAIKKLTPGSIVVVSGDGKAVSPTFLKVFKDETLVLASPELVSSPASTGPLRSVPMLPAVPGQPGAIQVQIVPGGAAQPALPVAPAPSPAKPANPEKPTPAIPEKPVSSYGSLALHSRLHDPLTHPHRQILQAGSSDWAGEVSTVPGLQFDECVLV
jgi:hypothetical protein